MPRILFLALFLFSGTISSAKDFRLDFSDLHIENNSWSFHFDSIIDVRKNKKVGGFVYKGLANKKKVAFFKNPLRQDLERLLIDEQKVKYGEGFILRINHFFIYEAEVVDNENAVAEWNISFIQKDEQGYTEIFQASHSQIVGAVDVTSWHEENAIDGLRKCLDDFEIRKKEGKLRPLPLKSEELYTNPYGKRTYPIERAKPSSKATFHSFYDFRDNTPDTSIAFEVEYRKRDEHPRAEIKFPDSKLSEPPFAFSDGSQFYFYGKRYSLPMKRSRGEFVIKEHPEYQSHYEKNLIASTIVGGVLGAAIHGARNPHDTYKDSAYIDMDNGTLRRMGMQDVKEIYGQTVLFASDFNTKDQVITLFIGGDSVCQLQPGTYYVHYSDYKSEAFSVCLYSGDQQYCEEIEPEVFKMGFYLGRFGRKEKLKLQEVPHTVKKRLYTGIREAKFSEACPRD